MTNTADAKSISALIAAAAEMPDYVIMDEFRDLLPILNNDELVELEKSIKADGVRDPLVIWDEKNVIVDGHNRWKICQKLNIVPPETRKSFKNEGEVSEWMMRNQLGRRNLTQDMFKYYIGKLYNTVKQKSENGVGGVREKMDGDQTAEKIAKQYGVSEKTVRRAATNANAIDRLEKIKGRMAKTKQLSGEKTYTAPELAEIAKAPSEKVAEKLVEKLDTMKEAEKAKKATAKTAAKEVKEKIKAEPAKTYAVAFCAPNFESLMINQMPKPNLGKDAAVYVEVDDAYLDRGIDLLRKWGLSYECSFIIHDGTKEAGTFSNVAHTFVIVGIKGNMVGPKIGKEACSIIKAEGKRSEAMKKVIAQYHPKEELFEV